VRCPACRTINADAVLADDRRGQITAGQMPSLIFHFALVESDGGG
jgi:hypothetical protein